MPKDGNPINVVAIEWQKQENFIEGIRMVLSNGQKSPALLALGVKEKNMQRCDLKFPVKWINGTNKKYNAID